MECKVGERAITIFKDIRKELEDKYAIFVDLNSLTSQEGIHNSSISDVIRQMTEGNIQFPFENLNELFRVVIEKFKLQKGATYFGQEKVAEFLFELYSPNKNCIIAQRKDFYFSFSKN